MRVDQTAIATPSVAAQINVRPAKEETRQSSAPARPAAAPSSGSAGLRVSISDAARQAANGAAAVQSSNNRAVDTAQSVESVATAASTPVAAPASNAASASKPQGVLEGIPWPVGIGPPPWPVTQGAAAAVKLEAARVPAQAGTLARAPVVADQNNGVEAQRRTERASSSAVAQEARAAQAAASASASLNLGAGGLAGAVAQSPASQPRPLTTEEVQARDAAQRAADQRQAASAYASEKAAAEAAKSVSLRV